MANLEQIYASVTALRTEIQTMIVSAKLNPKQITIIDGLSDISKSLGTIYAGEFLALSSGEDPQDSDGTGTFMSALGRTFDSVTYHIGGVNSGEIQWGANSSDGTLMAGGNSIVLTSDGIKLDHTDTSTTGIIWKEDQDTGTYYPFIHDFSHPTGNTAKPVGYNLFMGIDSGNFTMGSTATSVEYASYNIGVGYSTLKTLTTGYNNIAIGYKCLNKTTGGGLNIAIGRSALRLNTTGTSNIAIGTEALENNTTLGSNIAIGSYASKASIGGSTNIAIGGSSLTSNQYGDFNIAIGNAALSNNTSADTDCNIAIGSSSMYYGDGRYNIGLGVDSLYSITGDFNVALGHSSGYSLTTASYNTFIGRNAGTHDDQKLDVQNSMALGYNSYTTADNQIVLGNSSVTAVATYGNYQRFANSTTYTGYLFVPLTSPLTSASWDLGDSIADADYTAIDLSSVFSAPAGIKAVLVRVAAKDNASAASTTSTFALGPTDDETKDALAVLPRGVANSTVLSQTGIVPCDANGDIYYRAVADGTLNVSIEIWGYWI